MSPEELKSLLLQPEGPCLEFKRELVLKGKLKDAVKRHREVELAKDIMALANTYNEFGLIGYLIIGAIDDTESRVTDSPGLAASAFDTQSLEHLVKRYCREPVPFEYSEVSLEDGRRFGVIKVEKFLKPHHLAVTVEVEYLVLTSETGDIDYIVDKQQLHKSYPNKHVQHVQQTYEHGTVYLRNNAHIRRVTPEEYYALRVHADAKRVVPQPISEVVNSISANHIPTLFSSIPFIGASFVGRDIEIQTVLERLDTSSVLFLEGIAGIGKTTLASHIATKLSAHYQILWFTCPEYLSLSDLFSALHHFARKYDYDDLQQATTGLDNAPARARSIVSYLEEIGSFLLVLDDLPSLNDAPFNSFLEAFIRHASKTRILLCTRNRPKLLHELPSHVSEVVLKGLTVSEFFDLVRSLGLHEDNNTMLELHTLVEGHPFATKLFVSLVTRYEYEPRELLKEASMFQEALEERWLTRLYALLNDAERELLNKVAVFVAPVSRDAVAALTDNTEWKLIFDSLIDRFLISAESHGRFSMHALVRGYSYQQLGNKTETHRRAAQYYLHNYQTTGYQRDIPEAEIQDKLQAHYHFSNAGDTETANQIVSNIQHVLMRWGEYPQLMLLLNAAVLSNPTHDPWYLYYQARIYRAWGDYEKGLTILNSIINATELTPRNSSRREKERLLAQAVQVKADILISGHRYQEARALLENHLPLLKSNRTSLFQTFTKMGKIFLAQAHYKEAERLFGECLRLQEQGGERLGMAIALVGLGQSARAQHHYEQAGILIQRALEFFTESGDRRARVWALTEHARTVQDKGDIGAALALYDQVIQESEQFNLKENLASVYTEAAALCDGLELAAKATSYRQRYESLARELQLQPWLSLITPMNP